MEKMGEDAFHITNVHGENVREKMLDRFLFSKQKKPNKNSNKFKRKQTNTSKGRETGKAKCSDVKEQAKQANANGQNKQRKKGTNSRN